MERKSFEDRLNEIYWELRKNWREIAKETGVSYRRILDIKNKKSDRLSFKFVERIGYGLGLIPIAFYREMDGTIEDLGIAEFFYGEKIDNYLGKVLKKHRELNDLSMRELGERVRKSHAYIALLEGGVCKASIPSVEKIGKELGLVPTYLLQRFSIAPPSVDGKLVDVDEVFKQVSRTLESYITPTDPLGIFEQAVRTLESYIAYSKDLTGIRRGIEYADRVAQLNQTLREKSGSSRDRNDLKRIMEYADRINELNQALKTKYAILEGQKRLS